MTEPHRTQSRPGADLAAPSDPSPQAVAGPPEGDAPAPLRALRPALNFPALFPDDGEEYDTDRLGRSGTLLGIAAAALGGGLLTLLAWYVLKLTHLPAFGGSVVSRALSTACTVIVLLLVIFAVHGWIRNTKHPERWRPWRRLLLTAVFYLSPAGLVITTTGIPLSATKLYLDGVTVDQGFRTQFLTRLADSPRLQDMNYIDLPSFYPGGWFWMGGRLANLLGIPGWEVFQPWALVSLAAAGCVLVPVWQRLCGSIIVANGIALVTVCLVLVTSAEEPYAAVIAMGAPAATIMVRRALRGAPLALTGLTLYIGFSAACYTLFTAVMALSLVVVGALTVATVDRSWRPVRNMLIVGIGSMAIAAIVWGPYYWAIFQGKPRSGATAVHYLPESGAQVPLPFLSLSIVGALCFMGLLYLIVRMRDADVASMGASLVVFYVWVTASMLVTLSGTTLLGFRMEVVITNQLATAGVLALAELRLIGVDWLYPDRLTVRARRTITFAMVTLLMFGGLSYAQAIPTRNHQAIDLAYTDTDGYGERADLYPPDATAYYADIDKVIQKEGYVPRETVLLTDEHDFLSYFPYHGFQAFTSHYANPLGQFDLRNKAIESWATDSWSRLQDPVTFNHALELAQWRSPDVFVFRGSAQDQQTGWKYDLAEDIYPNNPNVRYRGVFFNPVSFGEGWKIHQVGPFVVVIRER